MSTNAYMSKCPRCGTKAFEKLSTHGHCVECLYTEDDYFDLETAYHQAKRIERELAPAKLIEFPKRNMKQKGEAS
jgi:ribosomal protein L37E